VQEPGLDLHVWETEWEMLQPLLEDSPIETLPELDDLVHRMLVARGFAVDDPVADDAVGPEIVVQYREATRVARLIDAGESIDPGDVAAAINGLREIYDYLIEDRAAP
jgi:hypothetical protein